MVSLGWNDAPDRRLSCSSTWWKLEGRATGEVPPKRHLNFIFLVVCIPLVRGCPTAAAVEGAVQEGALDVSIECDFVTPESLNPHQSTHTLCFSRAEGRGCHNV